jgi:hypothetical protein
MLSRGVLLLSAIIVWFANMSLSGDKGSKIVDCPTKNLEGRCDIKLQPM